MRWVKLSSTYYLDPKVMGLSADAERVFLRSIAYSGAAETDGFVPDSALVQLGNKRGSAPIRALVDAELMLKVDGGYRIAAWDEWQRDSGDRRAADRDRQARKRANDRKNKNTFSAGSALVQPRTNAEPTANQPRTSAESGTNQPRTNRENLDETTPELGEQENVSRDMSRHLSRDVTPLEQIRAEQNYLRRAASSPSEPREQQLQPGEFDDGTPLPDEPPDAAPTHIETAARPTPIRVSPAAKSLVRLHTPPGMPRQVLDALAEQVQRLSNDRAVAAADIEAGLAEWARRTGVGPALLPHLVADAAKTRGDTRARAGPATASKADIWQTAVIDPTQAAINQQRALE